MIPHYTPSKLSREDLKSMFISEKGISVLERAKKDLEKRAAKGSNQHYLVLGPRGIGKSHLLACLYYMIKETKKVNSHWIPLWFSEEEYALTSLRDLMERLLQEAIMELSDTDSKIVEGLEEFQLEIETNGNGEEVAELVKARFMDLEKELKKRFVVIFENFNLFLKDISSGEEKKLRSLLMNETVFLFICSAPTLHHYLKEVADPGNALFNLFDVHYLNEFTLQECQTLIERQRARDRLPQLPELLKEDDGKLKVIHRLAGGNPRLVLMFYQICYSLKTLPEMEETFGELLEKLTPYFQARTEGLSAQQRKILISFAEINENMTPAGVGKKLHLQTNQITAQIRNLMDYGFLRVVDKEGNKRGTYYELSERIYRYWYQSRAGRGKKIIVGIVEFISFRFSYEELRNMEVEWTSQLGENMKGGDADLINKRIQYIQESIKFKESYLARSGPKGPHISSDHDYWFKEGAEWSEKGNNEKAVECLEKAIKIKPDSHKAWNNMGACYYAQENHKKAVECCEKAIKIKPDFHEAWYNRGVSYDDQGNHMKGMECYGKAIKIKPDFHEAWYNMGVFYDAQGNHKKAVECYEKTIKIRPNSYEAWYNMGVSYDAHGNHMKAMECYEKVIKIKPGSYEVWNNMGASYYTQGNHKKAVECYEKIIKINPNSYEAWNSIGASYSAQGNHMKAMECYKKAIKIKPDYDGVWNNMGASYYTQGNHKKAVECYEKVIKIKPDNHAAWNNVGCFSGSQGNHKKAVECYEEAIKINPDYHEAWDNMGSSYTNKGNHKKAVECLEKAIKINPKNYKYFLHICIAELMLKNRTRATYCMEEALTLMFGEWAKEKEGFLMFFLSEILKIGEYDFVWTVIECVEHKKDTLDHKRRKEINLEFLRPFKILVEYLETGDKNLLDRQPKEIRETIKEMALRLKGKKGPNLKLSKNKR